ncbi:MAG TPA: hypothetical protein VNU20_10030 [Candidatus Sulfotelmatobacter sp.]|jgi:hypothetical protein|nr:hypothetical protein [Candidatus Sulfotelmatobacter sp.]
MAEEINSFRERYSVLSDDELQNLAITGGLTDQARELLEQELRRRGIEDVSEYREHLERFDREHLEKKWQALERKENYNRLYSRIGYSISTLGILAGLFVRYVQRDEINGTGIIITSVILFPLVWMIAQIRRLIWRFLLRP